MIGFMFRFFSEGLLNLTPSFIVDVDPGTDPAGGYTDGSTQRVGVPGLPHHNLSTDRVISTVAALHVDPGCDKQRQTVQAGW
nr:hypothetical protein [uncultured Rhodopila sp.]